MTFFLFVEQERYIIRKEILYIYIFFTQSDFTFQREETQVVDPRVIHVTLAMEPTDEVRHFYCSLLPVMILSALLNQLQIRSFCTFQDRRRKEADGAKGECGRRRRTASEGDEDVTLKRFKGTGEVEPNGQTDSGSVTADCESTVMNVTWSCSGHVRRSRRKWVGEHHC